MSDPWNAGLPTDGPGRTPFGTAWRTNVARRGGYMDGPPFSQAALHVTCSTKAQGRAKQVWYRLPVGFDLRVVRALSNVRRSVAGSAVTSFSSRQDAPVLARRFLLAPFRNRRPIAAKNHCEPFAQKISPALPHLMP